MSFHLCIFAIFILLLFHDSVDCRSAHRYLQLPATASTVCTTDARLGGVGRMPPPPQTVFNVFKHLCHVNCIVGAYSLFYFIYLFVNKILGHLFIIYLDCTLTVSSIALFMTCRAYIIMISVLIKKISLIKLFNHSSTYGLSHSQLFVKPFISRTYTIIITKSMT